MIVEAEGLAPSHDIERNFAQTEGFPTREDGSTLNDRDYQHDKSAQQQVLTRSRKYDGRAVQDMPIIDKNGIVLSGNDRTMSGQLAAKQGTDTEYLEYLGVNAEMYGLDEEQVREMRHPRLVFELEENMPYTTQSFAIFNANERKTQNNTEKAIKVGKTISEKTIKMIAEKFDEYESIAECLQDIAGSKFIIDRLVEDGILQRNDVEEMVEERGLLNATGKEFVQTVLLGTILNEESIRIVGSMPFIRNIVLSSLNEILQNRKLSDKYTLNREINEAIKVVYEAHKQQKIKQGEVLTLYYSQIDIFTGEANIKEVTIQLLADILNGTKVKELKKVLLLYNVDAQSADNGELDMFGVPGSVKTKEQILKDILKRIKENEQRKSNAKVGRIGNGNIESKESGGTDGTESGYERERSGYKSQRNNRGRVPTDERGRQRTIEQERIERKEGYGEITQKNTEFNDTIEELTEGNADSVILRCGKPSKILKEVGIPNKEIVLQGNKLIKKAKQHKFDISNVKDLPIKLQTPTAIFKGSYEGSFVVLSEIKINGKNAVISIDINKGEVQDINLITSIYDKADEKFKRWVYEGKLLYKDKEKSLVFLSSSTPIVDATKRQETSEGESTTNKENSIVDEAKKKIKEKLSKIKTKEINGLDIDEYYRQAVAKGGYFERTMTDSGKWEYRYYENAGTYTIITKAEYDYALSIGGKHEPSELKDLLLKDREYNRLAGKYGYKDAEDIMLSIKEAEKQGLEANLKELWAYYELAKTYDKWYNRLENYYIYYVDNHFKEVEKQQEIKPIGKGEFGNIYDQFKGKTKEAIEFLKERKEGEVLEALYHKDVGYIDLIWGKEGTAKSDGYGISKLIKYHPEVVDNLQKIINDMHITQKTDNRIQLENDKYKASVRLTWNNKRKTCLLTAFQKNSVSDNTTDTGETIKGKRNDTATSQNTISNSKGTTKTETDKEREEKYAREIPKDKAECKERIKELLQKSKQEGSIVERVVVGGITDRQKQDLNQIGVVVDKLWVHSLENSAVLHTKKQHGNSKTENKREQEAITESDYELIPDILENYDKIEKSTNKDNQGRDVIIYQKEYSDGNIYYLEEVREKRKSLAFKTMYKKKKGSNTSDGFMQKSPTLTSETASDTLTSESKGTTKTETDKEREEKERKKWDKRNKESLLNFREKTDSTGRTSAETEKFDSDNISIPLTLDGQASSISIAILLSDDITEPGLTVALYEYPTKTDADLNKKEWWQEFENNIEVYNKNVPEKERGFEYLDTPFIQFRSVDACIKFADFLKNRLSLQKTGGEVEQMTSEEKELMDIVAEEQAIIDKAKAEGTYMKAPNGKKTNLTEKQWVQVRTKAFKEWFGDWEKTARIEKLKKSKSIIATGEEYKGKYELDNKSADNYIKDNLRNEYTNKDTGDKIKITRTGAEKVTRHDAENEIHLKSIALIPEMLENAVFITETTNEKEKRGFDSYKYYVVGLNIGGVDYTAKLVIGVKNGQTYYDHALTEISKEKLLDERDRIKRLFINKENLRGKDTRLFSIISENSSKVVDENGEPRVVYHITDSEFNVFDREQARVNSDVQGFFFSSGKEDWADMGENIMGVFLNIKNLTDKPLLDLSQNRAGEKARELLQEQGYDGTIVKEDEAEIEYCVFEPNQIKSATDNTGAFNKDNNDIRFAKGTDVQTDRYLEKNDNKTEKNKQQKISDKVAQTISNEEAELRNVLVETMQEAGIEVVTDNKEAQRVLDIANGKVKTNGKTKKERFSTCNKS